MSNFVFAEDYIDCGNGCDWSEFVDPDVMEAIVAKSEKTHAQAVIEQEIKRKSGGFFQRLYAKIEKTYAKIR